MSDITWKTETIDVNKLKGLKNNPRSDVDIESLKKDIDSVGNFKPLVVDRDYTVLGGNQRMTVLKGKVEVSRPERRLTKEERDKVVILDNVHRGGFDPDMLLADFKEAVESLGMDNLLAQLDTEDYSLKNTEVDVDEMEDELNCTCPKCGFKFQDQNS